VRLGLSLIRGLAEDAAARIELARAVRPFADVTDLARRAQLTRRDLQALASANALASLAGNRRAALWHALAAVPDRDLLRAAGADDATPAFVPLTLGQAIAHDYRALGLTLGRHPLALLRAQLLQRRLLPATTLQGYRDGQLARAAW
jgi:error-prone DNA polymerase